MMAPVRNSRVIVSCLVAVLFATVRSEANEEEAIAAIEKLGGSVRKISQDTDQQEAVFHLSGQDLTDEGLVYLGQLSNLVWLNLANTKITDAGLQSLAPIKSLTRLHLEKTAIGDAGLSHLSGLENLEYLNLYGTQVSDAGLENLSGLKKLKKLYLWQSQATPDGVRRLATALPGVDINLGAEFEQAESPSYDQLLAKGQYVRVRLPGADRILSLAEVEVLALNSGEPLQSSGTSRQSSVDYEGQPERAHDGNTDADYSQGSVTHTQAEQDPWWVLDLGSEKEIAGIKVYNRADCCGDRLLGAVVDVLDASLMVVWSGTVGEAADGSVAEFAPEPSGDAEQ
jgi:hypothetical protein